MSQFKSKEQYEKDGPELQVRFNISTIDGMLKQIKHGNQTMLEEEINSLRQNGIKVTNQNGFTWYPPWSIRKVDVEI